MENKKIETQNQIISNNKNSSVNKIPLFYSNNIREISAITIIKNISELLEDICDENTKNFKENNTGENLNIKPFLSKNIPQISIKDYLERLYKHTKINCSTIILILIYIDRICNIQKFKLTYFNIHKLILASMIIANKFNEDEQYTTKFYSKLGGLPIAEIAFLEYNFFFLLNFNLFVKDELYKKYSDYISSADSEEDEYENENDNSKENDEYDEKNNENDSIKKE
jgi:hypothetical protein